MGTKKSFTLHMKTCARCGNVFRTPHSYAIYCSKCIKPRRYIAHPSRPLFKIISEMREEILFKKKRKI